MVKIYISARKTDKCLVRLAIDDTNLDIAYKECFEFDEYTSVYLGELYVLDYILKTYNFTNKEDLRIYLQQEALAFVLNGKYCQKSYDVLIKNVLNTAYVFFEKRRFKHLPYRAINKYVEQDISNPTKVKISYIEKSNFTSK